MEGLSAPLPARTDALLRCAVVDHVTRERRRVFPPVLHVGTPGGGVASLDAASCEPADHSLRTDLVAALRARAGAHDDLVWLTRCGGPDLQDVDVRWLAAARAAYDEAGAALTFVVVDRHGWRDPRSGLARTWARVRPRSR
ncbi:hypothetical protein [Nocardioides halotolerans]|uniref:hypothetical protein n=1 Tax=Nocardioides halotolerans TaxID=433660 RepID=UPI000422B25A|nr:hypothetical protein [Nocardioides halotolerans]